MTHKYVSNPGNKKQYTYRIHIFYLKDIPMIIIIIQDLLESFSQIRDEKR